MFWAKFHLSKATIIRPYTNLGTYGLKWLFNLMDFKCYHFDGICGLNSVSKRGWNTDLYVCLIGLNSVLRRGGNTCFDLYYNSFPWGSVCVCVHVCIYVYVDIDIDSCLTLWALKIKIKLLLDHLPVYLYFLWLNIKTPGWCISDYIYVFFGLPNF